MNEALLTLLTQTPGPPGHEDRIREVVRRELASDVDEVQVDPLGNVVARRHGSGPRIMLAAHMDQIGFMVRAIDSKGFLRLNPVGGFDPRNLFARIVSVLGQLNLSVVDAFIMRGMSGCLLETYKIIFCKSFGHRQYYSALISSLS